MLAEGLREGDRLIRGEGETASAGEAIPCIRGVLEFGGCGTAGSVESDASRSAGVTKFGVDDSEVGGGELRPTGVD